LCRWQFGLFVYQTTQLLVNHKLKHLVCQHIMGYFLNELLIGCHIQEDSGRTVQILDVGVLRNPVDHGLAILLET
jgi:hypothetical protein